MASNRRICLAIALPLTCLVTVLALLVPHTPDRRITKVNVLAIEAGMTKADVDAILGAHNFHGWSAAQLTPNEREADYQEEGADIRAVVVFAGVDGRVKARYVNCWGEEAAQTLGDLVRARLKKLWHRIGF